MLSNFDKKMFISSRIAIRRSDSTYSLSASDFKEISVEFNEMVHKDFDNLDENMTNSYSYVKLCYKLLTMCRNEACILGFLNDEFFKVLFLASGRSSKIRSQIAYYGKILYSDTGFYEILRVLCNGVLHCRHLDGQEVCVRMLVEILDEKFDALPPEHVLSILKALIHMLKNDSGSNCMISACALTIELIWRLHLDNHGRLCLFHFNSSGEFGYDSNHHNSITSNSDICSSKNVIQKRLVHPTLYLSSSDWRDVAAAVLAVYLRTSDTLRLASQLRNSNATQNVFYPSHDYGYIQVRDPNVTEEENLPGYSTAMPVSMSLPKQRTGIDMLALISIFFGVSNGTFGLALDISSLMNYLMDAAAALVAIQDHVAYLTLPVNTYANAGNSVSIDTTDSPEEKIDYCFKSDDSNRDSLPITATRILFWAERVGLAWPCDPETKASARCTRFYRKEDGMSENLDTSSTSSSNNLMTLTIKDKAALSDNVFGVWELSLTLRLIFTLYSAFSPSSVTIRRMSSMLRNWSRGLHGDRVVVFQAWPSIIASVLGALVSEPIEWNSSRNLYNSASNSPRGQQKPNSKGELPLSAWSGRSLNLLQRCTSRLCRSLGLIADSKDYNDNADTNASNGVDRDSILVAFSQNIPRAYPICCKLLESCAALLFQLCTRAKVNKHLELAEQCVRCMVWLIMAEREIKKLGLGSNNINNIQVDANKNNGIRQSLSSDSHSYTSTVALNEGGYLNKEEEHHNVKNIHNISEITHRGSVESVSVSVISAVSVEIEDLDENKSDSDSDSDSDSNSTDSLYSIEVVRVGETSAVCSKEIELVKDRRSTNTTRFWSDDENMGNITTGSRRRSSCSSKGKDFNRASPSLGFGFESTPLNLNKNDTNLNNNDDMYDPSVTANRFFFSTMVECAKCLSGLISQQTQREFNYAMKQAKCFPTISRVMSLSFQIGAQEEKMNKLRIQQLLKERWNTMKHRVCLWYNHSGGFRILEVRLGTEEDEDHLMICSRTCLSKVYWGLFVPGLWEDIERATIAAKEKQIIMQKQMESAKRLEKERELLANEKEFKPATSPDSTDVYSFDGSTYSEGQTTNSSVSVLASNTDMNENDNLSTTESAESEDINRNEDKDVSETGSNTSNEMFLSIAAEFVRNLISSSVEMIRGGYSNNEAIGGQDEENEEVLWLMLAGYSSSLQSNNNSNTSHCDCNGSMECSRRSHQLRSMIRSMQLLDNTPVAPCHKSALLFRPCGATSEWDVLCPTFNPIQTNPEFAQFMNALGCITPVGELQSKYNYTAGIDVTGGTDGSHALVCKDSFGTIVFHSPALLIHDAVSGGSAVTTKTSDECLSDSNNNTSAVNYDEEELTRVRHRCKRLVGNDAVHVIFCERETDSCAGSAGGDQWEWATGADHTVDEVDVHSTATFNLGMYGMIQILVTPTVTTNTNANTNTDATASTDEEDEQPFYRIDVRATHSMPELHWMNTTQFLPMKEGLEFIKAYCMLVCSGCRSVLSERVASEVPSNALAREHLIDQIRDRYGKDINNLT